MQAHEQTREETPIEAGSDRSFGLIVGGILAAISLLPLIRSADPHWWLLIPSVLLMLFAVAAPRLLHPLNVAWMKLGLLLGMIVSPVALFLIYLVAIVPVGLMLRVSGKDLLALRRRAPSDSYWTDRTPPGPAPESLKDQF